MPLLGSRPNARREKTVTITLAAPAGLRDALVLPQEDPPGLLLLTAANGGGRAGGLASEFHPGDPAYATGAEAEALRRSLQVYLPSLGDTRRADAAVHAPAAPGEEVRDLGGGGGGDGLLLASGAGVTRFRRAAEDAVDLACRKLGRALSVPPCRTASTPLPEPPDGENDCLTLRDFLERRVPADWTAAQREAALPEALHALSARHGWDPARQSAEIKAWHAETALGQTFRVL